MRQFIKGLQLQWKLHTYLEETISMHTKSWCVFWVIQRHWKLTHHFYKLHQSDDILKFFLEKKKSHFVLFIEASVHLQEHKELNTYLNDTNENALERGGLDASFELYDRIEIRLRTVLSSFKLYPLWIFSACNCGQLSELN